MIYLENETDIDLGFDFFEIADSVVTKTLLLEGCPFEVEVSILLTDNEGIHVINRDARDIDRPTDVLSFPNLYFEAEGKYDLSLQNEGDYINPENGLVVLGDIIISLEKVISQAKEYGHSTKREYAFLIAHSMLHLSGYDHMEEDEAARMEAKQRIILDELGITRD